MGIASYNIEYLNGSGAGSGTRSLGSTGSNQYWSRITIITDNLGCSKFAINMITACYNGATATAYSQGAQAVISTSKENTTYVGTTANMSASHPSNDTTWIFNGSISCDMAPNTTYYVFVLPVWTTANLFTTATSEYTVTSETDLPIHTLTVSIGANSGVTVNRTASRYVGTGILSNGENIFNGDVLKITFTVNTGYDLITHTVNGSAFTSGGTHTVSGNVTIVSAAKLKEFLLSLSAGNHSTIDVTRTSSNTSASIGTITDGATIYYGDVLVITFDATSGYKLETKTVNGVDFTSGGSHTVTANVTVIAIAKSSGVVYIDNGTTIEKYQVYIDNGSSWEQYVPYIDDGTAWNMCG